MPEKPPLLPQGERRCGLHWHTLILFPPTRDVTSLSSIRQVRSWASCPSAWVTTTGSALSLQVSLVRAAIMRLQHARKTLFKNGLFFMTSFFFDILRYVEVAFVFRTFTYRRESSSPLTSPHLRPNQRNASGHSD